MKMQFNFKKIFTLLFLIAVFLASKEISFAQTPTPDPVNLNSGPEYSLLAPIPLEPGVEADKVKAGQYLESAVKLAIGFSGILAVIMIIYGGFQYITSEGFGKKGKAKETITNALVGLLLVIGSFTILNTLNPDFLKLNLSITPVPKGEEISTNTPGVPPGSGAEGGQLPTKPDGTRDYTTPAAQGGYGPCPGCQLIPPSVLPLKGNCGPYGCMVYQTLFSKLISLNQLQGNTWRITEAWPPTVSHVSRCHNPGPTAGQCVDAALTNSPATAEQVKNFLNNIKKAVGSNFQYEVSSEARRQELIKAGLGNFKIIVNGTGEHAHINYP